MTVARETYKPMPGTGAKRWPECWCVTVMGHIVYQSIHRGNAERCADRMKVRNQGVELHEPVASG